LIKETNLPYPTVGKGVTLS